MNEHGGDGGVDTAGEAADDVSGTDLLADRSYGGLDEVGGSPVAACAADIEDEVFDELRAERCVVDFGVELHGPDATVFVGDGGEGVGGNGCSFEAGWQFEGFVTMAHPDLNGGGKTFEELDGSVFEGDFGVAVFALGGGANFTTEVVNDEVESVADAEGGQVELEECGVGFGSVCVVHGGRAAGEDEAERVVGLDFGNGDRTGKHDGEDV